VPCADADFFFFLFWQYHEINHQNFRICHTQKIMMSNRIGNSKHQLKVDIKK
jgi:hypothetical protein